MLPPAAYMWREEFSPLPDGPATGFAVSGMGFLGAGTIIKDKLTVRGLSTAAKLWISAAIGVAGGAGFLAESVVFTVFVLILICGINAFDSWFKKRGPAITVSASNGIPLIQIITNAAAYNNLSVHDIDILEVGEERTVARAYLPLGVSDTTARYFANHLDT
ncbi:MAG: MgtC/SapB family protein [Clostridia bacterium]|nr:MgtC/SapB family protein [Clostridia bacterium]